MAETLRAAGQLRSSRPRLRGLGRGAEPQTGARRRDDRTTPPRGWSSISPRSRAPAPPPRCGYREAGDVTNAGIDALLDRAADSLSEIRSGIDAQAAAVSALLEQAQAGLGRAGIEASQRSASGSTARARRSTR